MQYSFKNIEECNMCGTSIEKAKVLGRRMNRSQGVRPNKRIGISTTIMQCQLCSLIFANPLPIPASMSQHYETPPEEYWHQNYFEMNENYFKSQIKTFFELYKSRENLQALDIGAGVGKCMKALENSGFTAYGLEPSEPFYLRALEKMKVPPAMLKLSSVEAVDYSDNQFDFITFGAVLEHLYDPSAAIIKSLRWVKPDGLIHIEVPSSKWLTNKIYNLIYRFQGLDYVGNISPMHTPFHLYEFGLESFKIHGQKNKHEIAKYQFMVCDTFLPRIIDPLIKPIMEKTNAGMQLEVWLRKLA
jgi:2-polyprenyl-3-methyl-5-hydroxy-6-metoxy-1,4-benzoquinol methylase